MVPTCRHCGAQASALANYVCIHARMTTYVMIVQMTALPQWLGLDRSARQEVIREQARPVFDAHKDCRVRWVDAEAMTASCSDVMLVETGDLTRWNHLWEAMRDTAIFTVPYFRVEAITPGIEDGYLAYEATLQQ